MRDAILHLNGVNGATGDYWTPDTTIGQIAEHATAFVADSQEIGELTGKYRARRPSLALRLGISPTRLDQAGWGVIFSQDDSSVPQLKDALAPLLELRQAQAGALYREFLGEDGYRSEDTKNTFLARHRMGPGLPDPVRVPYYLLIVASPSDIPYRFQYLLDIDYAVGRVHLEHLEDYLRYAEAIVSAEEGRSTRGRSACFFGTTHAEDAATRVSSEFLIAPLALRFASFAPAWKIRSVIGEDTTKEQLKSILTSRHDPALLFTATHGVAFPFGHPRQVDDQGALLCQDWPGPRNWGKQQIPPKFYFSGRDATDLHVEGLIAFNFACYGAGTSRYTEYARKNSQTENAPNSFVARLPQQLLASGALAVISHVDRVWSYSFMWPNAAEQIAAFEEMLKLLVLGNPVGAALEPFNSRYAALSAELNSEREEIVEFGRRIDDVAVGALWTAANDARSYVIVGDPAVRICSAQPK